MGIDDVREHYLAAGPLPFEDGTFDAVFAGEIIEHLVDTGAFVAELRRVLAPGGIAVITTPNLASNNRARLLLGRYPRWAEWELPTADAAPFHDQGHARLHAAHAESAVGGARAAVEQCVAGSGAAAAAVERPDPAADRAHGDWMPGLSQPGDR